MKGTKTSLFLVELMISLLLFAFCAAICIQIFHAAGERTRKSEALSKGVFYATSAAEIFKSSGGDIDAVADALGGEVRGGTVYAHFDSEWNIKADGTSYTLILNESGDGAATIEVEDVISSENKGVLQTLFSIRVKAVS
ncbi:MAG: hypothetical protein LBN99_01000 [Oscillospiraceae bacterium]|jgi:hypothetical protein|nr:hypothetical protein [Oscillospiraceae bacterium]